MKGNHKFVTYSSYVLNTHIPPHHTTPLPFHRSVQRNIPPLDALPAKGSYTEELFVFTWNSNLAGLCVFLFTKSGNHTQEVLIISQFVKPTEFLLSLWRPLLPIPKLARSHLTPSVWSFNECLVSWLSVEELWPTIPKWSIPKVFSDYRIQPLNPHNSQWRDWTALIRRAVTCEIEQIAMEEQSDS